MAQFRNGPAEEYDNAEDAYKAAAVEMAAEIRQKNEAQRGLPIHLRGDGPCDDCGTEDNIVWFTESVFWNEVIRQDGGNDAILCIPCFIKRVDARGFFPTGWRLLPDWHWETTSEREARRRAA